MPEFREIPFIKMECCEPMPKKFENTDYQTTRIVAFCGIFIAVLLGAGYALALVPNVELLTALIFSAGVLMSYKYGILIGVLGELLFSALNPMGSGLLFPPLLLAQLVAMGVVAFSGALLRRPVLNAQPGLRTVVILGGTGLFLTLFYDILTSAAFPVSAGFTLREIIVTIIAGLAFSGIHLISNTLVFILLVPVLTQKLYQAIPFFADFFPVMPKPERSNAA